MSNSLRGYEFSTSRQTGWNERGTIELTKQLLLTFELHLKFVPRVGVLPFQATQLCA